MKKWAETRQVLTALAGLVDRTASSADAATPDTPVAALATVVRVNGSAYRHEGAKLLVARDGSTVGNVSGGCLEGDVREVAIRVMATANAEARAYCSGTDEVEAWDLGVGCEGRVDVRVEPVSRSSALAARSASLRSALEGHAPFVVVSPSFARDAIADAPVSLLAVDVGYLLVGERVTSGSLGDALLDAAACTRARELIASQRAPESQARSDESLTERVGGVELLFDVFVPPPALVIVGAGDDAQPLAQCAAMAGFRVVVADRRPGLLTRERFASVSSLVEVEPEAIVTALPRWDDAYAVVMSHNYQHDLRALRALLETSVQYIGMLGPRQRTERMLDSLGGGGSASPPFVTREAHPSRRRDARPECQDDLDRVFGPVGLDIGTDGAEQVALSVVSEMLAVRSGRPAQSLRDRRAPIHARGG